MHLKTICLSFLLCPAVAVAQVIPTLRWSEIMYDAEGIDTGHEWVEVYNFGNEPVVINTGTSSTSWRFWDDDRHTLSAVQGGAGIMPHDFAIIAADGAQWLLDHPGFAGMVFDTNMSLRNSTGTIGLAATPTSPPFTSVTYENSWGGAGNGKTLEKTDLTQIEDTVAFWRESTIVGGTPGQWELTSSEGGTSASSTPTTTPADATESGAEGTVPASPASGGTSANNSVRRASADVHINELFPNPPGSDSAEWIELVNDGSESVDLEGWRLQDATSHIYVIDRQTILPPYGFALVNRSDSDISLNNSGGDTVRLYQADGVLRDSTEYAGTAKEGYSWARALGDWKWTPMPTPSQPNNPGENNPPRGSISIVTPGPYAAGMDIEFEVTDMHDHEQEPITCRWDFGDGSRDDECRTTHAFLETGAYAMSVRLQDESGNVTPVEAPIEVVQHTALTEAGGSPDPDSWFVITELFPMPVSGQEEWIELKNMSSHTSTLEGWCVKDAAAKSPCHEVGVEAIAPALYVTLTKQQTKLSLNNSGDSVILIDPKGSERQRVTYTRAQTGKSYALHEASGIWEWTSDVSSGSEYVTSVQTPVVLGYATSTSETMATMARGTVIVPPGIMSQTKMLLLAEDGSVIEARLKRGQRLKVSPGQEIVFPVLEDGPRDQEYLLLSSADDVMIIQSDALPAAEAYTDGSGTQDRYVYGSLIGNIERVNKKSLSLSLEDTTATVYPISASDLHSFKRGQAVRVIGAIDQSQSTLKVYAAELATVNVEAMPVATTTDMDVQRAVAAPGNQAREKNYMAVLAPIAVGIGWLIRKYVWLK